MTRIEKHVGEYIDIELDLQRKLTAAGAFEDWVIDANDTITVKAIGIGWESTEITIDISVSPHANTNLATSLVVAEFEKTETENWQAGQVTYHVTYTPTGTTQTREFDVPGVLVANHDLALV